VNQAFPGLVPEALFLLFAFNHVTLPGDYVDAHAAAIVLSHVPMAKSDPIAVSLLPLYHQGLSAGLDDAASPVLMSLGWLFYLTGLDQALPDFREGACDLRSVRMDTGV